jgi:transcriptional regulator with PAS, ATPase and Fis domain
MSRDPAGSTRSYTEESSASSRARPEPHLFLVLECHRPLAPPVRFALDEIDEVVLGRGKTRAFRRKDDDPRGLEIRLEDERASSQHALLRRGKGSWTLKDNSSKNGSFVNGVKQSEARLADGDILELGHTFFLFRQSVASEQEEGWIYEAAPVEAAPPGLSSILPSLRRLFREIASRAASEISMLVEGETGTGKELVARAIHSLSGRKGKLVPINCGELTGNLVEANLFGYRKGAFTGAHGDHHGLIRSADRGTLFLDELGDLPFSQQALWLRVLQERVVRPLGSDADPLPVDLRIVAATNRPLDDMVKAGQFRRDLLQRLAGHRITLPPLRDRLEDLGLMLAAFARRAGKETLEIQSRAALAMLMYDWPGNVRELESCVHSAWAAGGGRIELRHLPEAVQASVGVKDDAKAAARAALKDRLVASLTRHEGNVSAVAREMDKDRAQIWRWLKGFEIQPEDYRP